jgi:F0F1-type ATP synthase assembly protein I
MRAWGRSIMAPDDPSRPSDMGFYLALAGVGVEMVVPIIVGAWLDSYYGWNPWGILVGVILGFLMSLTHLVVLLKRRWPPDKPRRDGS